MHSVYICVCTYISPPARARNVLRACIKYADEKGEIQYLWLGDKLKIEPTLLQKIQFHVLYLLQLSVV